MDQNELRGREYVNNFFKMLDKRSNNEKDQNFGALRFANEVIGGPSHPFLYSLGPLNYSGFSEKNRNEMALHLYKLGIGKDLSESMDSWDRLVNEFEEDKYSRIPMRNVSVLGFVRFDEITINRVDNDRYIIKTFENDGGII